MASDRLVSPKLILESHLQLQRQGSGKMMAELEQLEPDLAEWLMENLSLIHQKLLTTGASPKRVQSVYRRIEGLVLVCLHAQRQAHHEFWNTSAGEALEQLDPDREEPDHLPPAEDPPKPGL